MRPASIPHTFVTAAAALALTAAGLSPALAESGKKFIQHAVQGDNAEIEMGHLAAQKSGNQQVKDFGNMLVTDHTTAKNQATDVGRQIKVKPSDGLPRAARREERKLKGMSGAAFDINNLHVYVGARLTFINDDNDPHDMLSGPFGLHNDCPEINVAGYLVPGQSRATDPLTHLKACGFHDHNREGNPAFGGTVIAESR